MTSSTATSKLNDAGFTKVKIVTDTGKSEAMTDDWTVKSQTPTAGSSATADTEIVLTLTQITGKG